MLEYIRKHFAYAHFVFPKFSQDNVSLAKILKVFPYFIGSKHIYAILPYSWPVAKYLPNRDFFNEDCVCQCYTTCKYYYVSELYGR